VTSSAAAGYSGTPQSRKLGIKPGTRLAIDNAPPGWELLDPPAEVTVAVDGQVDVLISFSADAAGLAARLPELVPRICPAGAIWIAWPRKAGGHRSDITDNIVREIALPLGIVDVKVAAIDQDWSGLRFVWRLSNR
jgi:hypothetical protein